jgi:hypothetical protein
MLNINYNSLMWKKMYNQKYKNNKNWKLGVKLHLKVHMVLFLMHKILPNCNQKENNEK